MDDHLEERRRVAKANGYYHNIEPFDNEILRLRVALAGCRGLFGVIRGDWTDPRHECRQGLALIDAALSPPRSHEQSEKGEN